SSPREAKRPSRSNEVGVRGRRLKSCQPCGEPRSQGKKDYSTADRRALGVSTPSRSKDRRDVGIGRARTPARAASSHHKVGRSQCRSECETTNVNAPLINVGIDVSKDRLDVAVRPSGETFSVDNDESGCAELRKRLTKLKPERIVLEATGG